MDSSLLPLLSAQELTVLIGQRVMARRKFLKLSRRELAEKSGVSTATIARLERGGVATIQVLVKVAIAMGSEDTFAGLFRSPAARTLDEVIQLYKDKT